VALDVEWLWRQSINQSINQSIGRSVGWIAIYYDAAFSQCGYGWCELENT
jgi:hypothetical protein